MELLDLYDQNGEKLGKTIVRGTPIRQGEYSMSVHMFIYDDKGRFLLQKRSEHKRSLPGIWSVTCGALISGEDSVQAGIREAKEELGLKLCAENFDFIGRIKRRHSFIDIFFIKRNFNIKDLVLQREEVDFVRVCDANELVRVIRSSDTAGGAYTLAVSNALHDRGLL